MDAACSDPENKRSRSFLELFRPAGKPVEKSLL